MIDQLNKDYLYYLASPYSKYPAGPEKAYEDISKIAGVLFSNGYNVFCPIAHSHAICEYSNITLDDYGIWLTFDEKIMRACDGIIVAQMVSWDTSIGVSWEIDWFQKNKNVDPIMYNVDDIIND